jgi:hypothetical protein
MKDRFPQDFGSKGYKHGLCTSARTLGHQVKDIANNKSSFQNFIADFYSGSRYLLFHLKSFLKYLNCVQWFLKRNISKVLYQITMMMMMMMMMTKELSATPKMQIFFVVE